MRRASRRAERRARGDGAGAGARGEATAAERRAARRRLSSAVHRRRAGARRSAPSASRDRLASGHRELRGAVNRARAGRCVSATRSHALRAARAAEVAAGVRGARALLSWLEAATERPGSRRLRQRRRGTPVDERARLRVAGRRLGDGGVGVDLGRGQTIRFVDCHAALGLRDVERIAIRGDRRRGSDGSSRLQRARAQERILSDRGAVFLGHAGGDRGHHFGPQLREHR